MPGHDLPMIWLKGVIKSKVKLFPIFFGCHPASFSTSLLKTINRFHEYYLSTTRWQIQHWIRPGKNLKLLKFSSFQFSHSVGADSLWPHGLQYARLACPLPSPRAYSNSCPSCRWCHPTKWIVRLEKIAFMIYCFILYFSHLLFSLGLSLHLFAWFLW